MANTAVIGINTSGVKIHLPSIMTPEGSDPNGMKTICFEMPDTMDGGDLLVFPLSAFNIEQLVDVWTFTHTTTDDVVVTGSGEFVSTRVNNGVVTIEVLGTNDNKKRVIVVFGN